MHPALSIVFFTTASGAGFSLFLLLGLGGPLALLPSSSGFGFAALALAALLAAGGWNVAVHDVSLAAYFPPHAIRPGTQFVWTYAGIFKCNVPVVVVVNSPLPEPFKSNGDIIGLVANAYQNASVPGTGPACQ